jgi:hypothetical protein
MNRSTAPNWQPLEALLGPALLNQFMYMGATQAPDGTPIFQYKHGMTRRYLHVSADLRTWIRVLDFRPYPVALALHHALDGAEELGGAPGVAYDAAYCAERDAALSAACGWEV